MLRAALLACLALLLLPAVAGAYVVQERGGLNSATNGIAVGPDGNLWVAEAGAGSVVRMSPGGQILQRLPVGGTPTTVLAGPGNRIWVAGTGTDRLIWIDATAATPSAHFVPTGSDCGPVGLAAGAGRIFFSTPKETGPAALACADASGIGWVADDGSGPVTVATGLGKAYDLVFSGSTLFVPDFEGTIVRRLDADLTATGQVTIGGTLVDGIAADGAGGIWVTLFKGGANVARFAADAPSGHLATPFATGLVNPFGIVAGADGRMYVAGKDSAEIARIDPAGNVVTRYGVPGSEPFQITNGTDGDFWFTDIANPRVFRFVNSAPRATTVAARALANTAGSVDAKVDSRGNATEVVFDYGTTTAYGATTAPQTVAAGIGENDVRADLPDLEPGTTYHVRVRASNAEGGVTGADVTFTTPKPDPTPVRATVAFRWGFTSSYTILTRVLVRQVARKDTIKLTCKGRGCAIKKKTLRNKKGKVKLTKHFGAKRRLRKGTRVRLRITAPNRIGSVVTLKVRSGKDPKITRRCTRPGSKKLRKRC
jgi:sugar lactone lactonase YvrE